MTLGDEFLALLRHKKGSKREPLPEVGNEVERMSDIRMISERYLGCGEFIPGTDA